MTRFLLVPCLPLLLLATGAATALAAPTALEVGPADPPFVGALVGVGEMETQLEQLRDYMLRVGLEDPGIDLLRGMALQELGARKGTLAAAIGLKPQGSAALYGVAAGGRLEAAFAADVSDRKKVIKTLQRMEEADQWVPDGKKPAKAKVTKRKLPGGGLEVHVALPDSSGVTARFQGEVVVLGDDAAVLDAMRLGGGSKPAILDKINTSGGDIGLVVAVSPKRIAEIEGDNEPALQLIDAIELAQVWGPSGFDTWAEVRLDPEVEQFVAVGKPGAAGAAARQVMQGLAGEDTGMWFRWSFDAQAALSLARNMLGPALDDGIKEMQKEIGLHLQKDVVDVFTGDMLMSCREGLADCIFVFGITDANKASKTVIKTLDAIAKDARRVGHDTVRKKDAGAKGSTVFETTFFEVPWDWEKDKPRKLKKGELRDDTVRVHWAVRDHALLIGLTPAEVAAATGRALPPATDVPELLKGRGFGDEDVMAGYQLVIDPSTLLRQLLPIARGFLPPQAEPGILTRAADALLALQDLVVDGGSLVEVQGTTFTLRGTVRAIPAKGQPGHDEALAKAYEEALAHRYQGRVRSSNEALLALAERAPDTVYATKARALALSGDGMGPMVMGVMTGLWSVVGLARAMEAPMMIEEKAMAVPAPVTAPGSGACAALESLTCSGPSYNRGSCQIARVGVEADCEVEFKALLGTP